jgi:hypothetical protein
LCQLDPSQRRPQQFGLAHLSLLVAPDQTAFAKRDDPVCGAKKFGVVVGDQHDRMPAVREVRDQAVDFRLRPDIDALRRIIEDKAWAIMQEPAAQNDFLLIAAGQASCREAWRRWPYLHMGDLLPDKLPLAREIEKAAQSDEAALAR